MKTPAGAFAITLLALATLNLRPTTAHAQGTAFTYQGRLNSGTNPANGNYDLTFALFDVSSGGSAVAGPVTNSATAVTNGLFTTMVDFGPGVFTGGSNWLQIAVRTNGGGSFTTLAPRQQLAPAPYAIFANKASNVSGTVSTAQLSGTIANGNLPSNPNFSGTIVAASFSGSGAGLTSINANNLSVGVIPTSVLPGFQPPNCATVGGGTNNTANAQYATVGGGGGNTANAQYATVGGGGNNMASGVGAAVCGGANNTAEGNYSFAGGANAQALYEGCFVWADDTGASFTSTALNQFAVRAGGGVLFNAGGGGVTFNTTGGIALDGSVLIGTNVPTAGVSLLVNGSANISSNIIAGSIGLGGVSNPYASIDLSGEIGYRGSLVWATGVTGGGSFGFFPGYGGSISAVATIDSSGNYHQVSDRGLKRDITDLDNTLERLLKLRPVSYHFHNAPTNVPLSLGFIAQEVQPLFPEIVGEQTNGVKDLVYSELIPVTIRSIQELDQKLETQVKQKDTEIQDLKQSNDVLARQLNELQVAVKALQKNK